MGERHPVSFRVDFKALWIAFRFARRYRKHPEYLESLLDAARARGASESDITTLREFFTASRVMGADHSAMYRADRYLVAGIGAIDLVLLPTILPLGVADPLLKFALLFLALSLVLVGWSLFLSHVKDELGVTNYGWVHSAITFLAQLLGVAALAATIGHFSRAIALIFLGLAIVATFSSFVYWWFARTAIEFVRSQQARLAAEQAAADSLPDTEERGADARQEHSEEERSQPTLTN